MGGGAPRKVGDESPCKTDAPMLDVGCPACDAASSDSGLVGATSAGAVGLGRPAAASTLLESKLLMPRGAGGVGVGLGNIKDRSPCERVSPILLSGSFPPPIAVGL